MSIPTSDNQCEHKFEFLRTAKWTDYSGSFNTGFFRIDTFYCTKCLEQKEVKKSELVRDTPDWYRD